MLFIRVLVSICIALALGEVGQAIGQTSEAQGTTGIWQETLPNGMRVVVKEDGRFPLVAMELVIRGGTAAELAEERGAAPVIQRGAAHFVEHMIFRGTRGRAVAGGQWSVEREDLGETVEGLGGQIEAGTLRDFSHYDATVLDTHWEEALGRLARGIRGPAFALGEVEAERRVLLAEAEELVGRPEQVLADAMFAVGFAGHPYAAAPWGDRATLAGMGAGALERYWSRVYVPANATLVIVGNVRKEEVVEAARTHFGDWAPKVEGQGPGVEGLGFGGPGRVVEVVLPYGGNTSLVGVGFIVPGAGPSDEPGAKVRQTPAGSSEWGEVVGLDVLYALLGRGTKSRLYTGIGEEGRGVSRVGCEYLTQRGPGLFYLWAEVEKGRGSEAAEAMVREMGRLLGEVPGEEEVERAKRIVKGSYAFSRETLLGEAKALGFYAALGDVEMAEDYERWVDSIAPEDLSRIARRHLDLGRRIVVVME